MSRRSSDPDVIPQAQAAVSGPPAEPAEARSARGSGHQAISYCPYCAEETLFPREQGWECRSCLRVFSVSFLGLTSQRGI